MQSGISATAELHSAFQTLLSTPSQRGILASISNETIIPGATIPSTTSTFLGDLVALQPHLTPNAALYIILRRADSPAAASGPSTGTLAAITYVPNAAPVRQKMLFASTRLTLTRELGSENFGETLFATEAEELTEAGWRRHEAHGEAANPLTQEEQDLEDIREAEALESRGTAGKGLVGGGGGGRIAMQAEEGVREAIAGLSVAGEGNLVQLKIDVANETLQLASVSSATPATLSTSISSTEPRFSFYKHTTSDAPIIFISTCPSTSKIKERMLYAASRSIVIQLAQGEAGITISKRIEATNPDEVTAQTIADEFKQQTEAKTGFARPKRPGKR
ncbi:actin monomer binding protein-like protein [Cenococcum geophilum 1.58]|uniref:actin monomer binding protein-like protein n=1 Tax=Cenococcum geophilum 1.58 TaxID=794803 RepID=UPI00358EBC50|nr:actin monomer binding protein-like protein [Cenococcum geophilum 1.58]